MRKLIWILVVLLGVLHYDFWYWDDPTLVAGFVPVGLAACCFACSFARRPIRSTRPCLSPILFRAERCT